METVELKLGFLRDINPVVANLRVGKRMLPGSRSTAQARSDGRIFEDGDLIHPTFYVADSVKDWIVDHLQNAATERPSWSVD